MTVEPARMDPLEWRHSVFVLAGLDVLGVVPAADELADAAVLVGVVFLCYDIAATRRVDGSSE